MTLYALKQEHGPLFHPALGREFVTREESCITLYDEKSYGEKFVLASPPLNGKCDSSNNGGNRPSQLMPKGTKLVITKVSVANADFGENYVMHAMSPIGELSLHPDPKLYQWLDGEPIEPWSIKSGLWEPDFLLPLDVDVLAHVAGFLVDHF
jgi:hypothetical protein